MFSLVFFVTLEQHIFLVLWISALVEALGGQKWPLNAINWATQPYVAPNVWISVDLGCMRVEHIQNGLLMPFTPAKIALGDVSCLVPTLIDADPPFQSLQVCL